MATRKKARSRVLSRDRKPYHERLEALRDLLGRAGGATLTEIAQRFGISYRQAFRDVQKLREKIPMTPSLAEDGSSQRWQIPPKSRRRALDISQLAMTSLFIVRQSFGWARGTFVHDELDQLCDQLEVNVDVVDEVDDIDRKFYDVGEDVLRLDRRTLRPKHLEHLIEAILQRHRVRVRYDGDEDYELDPYTFVTYRRAFYIVARSHNVRHMREPLRVFRVDRFRSIRCVEPLVTFDYDPIGYHPARFFDAVFGMFVAEGTKPETVRIALGPEAARHYESRITHKSQRFEPMPDGRTLFTLDVSLPRRRGRLAPALLGEFLPWIGDGTEVLEPLELRREMEHVLKEGLRRHA
jgi:predicted DNA-binding transcriptional regulator YafY